MPPLDLVPPKPAPAFVADLVERFKADSRDNPDVPPLRDFLPPADHPLWPDAVCALVRTDLDRRGRLGQPIALAPYFQQMPQLVEVPFLPQLIYEEFCARLRSGTEPDLAEYHVRFPEQFPDLLEIMQKDLVGSSGLVTRTSPTNAAPPPPVGARIGQGKMLSVGGDYKLLHAIGRGSYGEVWRAEAPGGVPVAVKIILRPIDEKESQREHQSLELMKNLRHPALLSMHSFTVKEDQLLIVTELADGSLRDRLKECRSAGETGIPLAELLTYFHEAAEALDFLHEHQILHRDVKPDNVLLFGRHAKVADFGLAKLFEDRAAESFSISGTPVYMSPESWQGTSSIHSDQYSLALSYAEMRLGRRVFKGDCIADLLDAHLHGPPDLAPLAEAEQRVLHRALAKEPGERFPSCREMVEALAEAVAVPKRGSRTSIPVPDPDAVAVAPTTAPGSSRSSGLRPRPSATVAGVATLAPNETAQSGTVEGRRGRRPPRRSILVALGLLFAGAVGAGLCFYRPWETEGPSPVVETHSTPPAALPPAVPDTVGELRSFAGHTGRVTSVALSRDGRLAVSGSDDGTVRAWDLETGREKLHFDHIKEVKCVAVSPDSRFVLSGGRDGLVHLWDLNENRSVRVFTGHMQTVWSVAFSPDGETVLSGSGGVELEDEKEVARDCVLRLWDSATGKERKQFTGHQRAVRSVAFSPDGKFIVSGSDDKTVRLWDLAKDEPEQVFRGHAQAVFSVAFAPDGKRIASASRDGTVRLWEPGSDNPVRVLDPDPAAGERAIVWSVAFAPVGARLLSGGADGTLRCWDAQSGTVRHTFTDLATSVMAVAVSADGRWALTGETQGKLRLWGLPKAE